MRATKALAALFLLLFTIFILGLAAHSQDAESVAAVAKPSVAVVLTQRPGGVGSGTAFLVAERLIVTAEHVIANSRHIAVKFPQHPPVEAQLVDSDSESDVAVLSIPPLHLRPLPLGDISQVREGQQVIVVGFPLIDALGAETATVTAGIVSAVRSTLIQMQAPVNPGNSGGPVLNLKGEVIGIVRGTLRGRQQGLNFATSINAAKPLLKTAASRTSPPQSSARPPIVTTELTIQITFLTSPVLPGSDARIEIQTKPGAKCSISVVYRSGPSRAVGLEPREADANGRVVWSWRVGANTSLGEWPIYVACVLGQQKAEVETEFAVRGF